MTGNKEGGVHDPKRGDLVVNEFLKENHDHSEHKKTLGQFFLICPNLDK